MSKIRRSSKEVPTWFRKAFARMELAYISDKQLLQEIERIDEVPDEIVQELVMRGYRDLLLLRYRDDVAFCDQVRKVAERTRTFRNLDCETMRSLSSKRGSRR